MTIGPTQRFRRTHPCPICGGYDELPRGRGVRCYGFLSEDGEWAHCARSEHAGHLEVHSGSDTYAHRLKGECKCGASHGGSAPALAVPSGPGRSPGTRAYEPPAGTLERTHRYVDGDFRPVHRTLRYRDPKDFRQQRFDAGRWRWGLQDTHLVLYNLPRIVRAELSVPVFLCEGEKDADRLTALGLIATTNVNGAKGWREHYVEWLRGRPVVIIEDNDEDGRKRTERITQSIYPHTASLQVVSFPQLGKGADVSDWLDAGGRASGLMERIDGPSLRVAV